MSWAKLSLGVFASLSGVPVDDSDAIDDTLTMCESAAPVELLTE